MTYVPNALEEHKLGVQLVAVICPVEDQILDAEDLDAEDLDAQDLDAEERTD